jgi:hypothetical protein
MQRNDGSGREKDLYIKAFPFFSILILWAILSNINTFSIWTNTGLLGFCNPSIHVLVSDDLNSTFLVAKQK